MRHTYKSEAKAVTEPNYSALQHAGLAALLVLVIFVSFVEMTRIMMNHASASPEIIRLD